MTAKKKSYKGERDRHTLRLPVDFSRAVRAQADAEGMSLNDFILRHLATVVPMPDNDAPQQEALKISA